MARSPAARGGRKVKTARPYTTANTPLARWLDTQSVGVVADALGVHRVSVYGWRYGHTRPKPQHAQKLVALSAGALTLDLIYADSPSTQE